VPLQHRAPAAPHPCVISPTGPSSHWPRHQPRRTPDSRTKPVSSARRPSLLGGGKAPGAEFTSPPPRLPALMRSVIRPMHSVSILPGLSIKSDTTEQYLRIPLIRGGVHRSMLAARVTPCKRREAHIAAVLAAAPSPGATCRSWTGGVVPCPGARTSIPGDAVKPRTLLPFASLARRSHLSLLCSPRRAGPSRKPIVLVPLSPPTGGR